ncbi:MAG: M20/M25/M40 family metallo-hydrolase [Candidatus Micrarchaeota archaeon]|nr:M20/M25/M40 family metallo-hydrolase [Candidatus Micrarchaeota archaeon]
MIAVDKSRPIWILRKLVSINSVFPNEASLAKFCAGYLSDCGFEVKLQEYSKGRFNVIAQKGPRAGSVLLSAHLDTVPPYNYAGKDPFRMLIKGGRIYGLGAWDMKAGLAVLLECARACKVSKRGIRVVLTSDEENISEGTWAAHRSGEFRGCSLAISHEIPDSAQKSRLSRPPIILGRRGRCVYRFRVFGIGAHGASGGGESAISLAFRLAAAIQKIKMPRLPAGECRVFIRSFHSESSSLSVPTEAAFEADAHFAPPFSSESFLAYLKSRLSSLPFPPRCRWEVEIPERKTPYLPAYKTDRRSPEVIRFLSAYEKHAGSYRLSFGLTVADENIISLSGVPVVTVGIKGGGAHSFGEWVSKKDYLLMFGKMPKILQEILGR